MKKIREDKGITLIALVITIIVLLILAGVSIAMLRGDNNIITKASASKEKTQRSQAEEELKLKITEIQMEKMKDSKELTLNGLKEELEKQDIPIDIIEDEEEMYGEVEYEGYIFEIGEDLSVSNLKMDESGNIEVREISINPKDVTLYLQNSQLNKTQLKVKILPIRATNKEIEWKSNNDQVVTVNNGMITAISEGSAIITAKTINGECSDTCNVTVKDGNILIAEGTYNQETGKTTLNLENIVDTANNGDTIYTTRRI